jgi:hypothetical protein
MENRVAREVAEAELKRFAEAMDLDIDKSSMDEEDRDSFIQQADRIISAIQRGSLVINDNGEPVYTTQRDKDSETFTFHEPTGASLMVMDTKKKNEDISRMFATMGELTRTSPKHFAKMKMSDLKVCLAVTTLFLG